MMPAVDVLWSHVGERYTQTRANWLGLFRATSSICSTQKNYWAFYAFGLCGRKVTTFTIISIILNSARSRVTPEGTGN